jgi:hypothetical protein
MNDEVVVSYQLMDQTRVANVPSNENEAILGNPSKDARFPA